MIIASQEEFCQFFHTIMFSFAGICSEEIKNFTANISRQNFNCSSSQRIAQQVRAVKHNFIQFSCSVGPPLSDQSDPVSPPSLFASLISGKNKSLEDLCWKVLSNEKDKRPYYYTIEFAINTAIHPIFLKIQALHQKRNYFGAFMPSF